MGRENELRRIRKLLAHHRLVTLLGPGGSGKSRLAREAARRFLNDYSDGVFFVELAALATPDRVPQVVANALGVEEGEPALIADHLRARQVLLVLDNCEHLIPACAGLLRELLEQCPRLRVLTTSLTVLGVDGEAVFRTPPLSLPPAGESETKKLSKYEAVQLFVQRAAAVIPDFQVTEQNAGAVAQICHRLDGVPLALELAAARIRLLTAQQIAGRLDDRFSLLTTGPDTADERHRTLRAAVEWGYEQLAPKEQICFRRLAVFAGPMTLEAAEKVCAGGGIEPREVADLVSQLLDKSFLQITADDGPQRRYVLLETLRAYGLEALAASNEAEAVRRLHYDWCLAMSEEAYAHRNTGDQVAWCDRLETEHDNLNAALRWSLQAGDTEACLRLAYLLTWFWDVRRYLREGRDWFTEALSRYQEPTPLRTQALVALGGLLYRAGDHPAAEAMYSEALVLVRGENDLHLLARVLNNLGMVATGQGDYDRARLLYEEAQALWLNLEMPHLAAVALYNLGLLAVNQAEHAYGRERLLEALRIRQQGNDIRAVAWTRVMLGQIAYYLGDWAEAWDHVNEAEAIAVEIRDSFLYATALMTRGKLLIRERRELDQAEIALRECFRLQREAGDRVGLWEPLVALAELAVLQGQPRQAARLLGAAEAIAEESDAPVDKADQPWYDGVVQSVLGQLGQKAMSAAWMVGRIRHQADLPEIEAGEPQPGESSRPAAGPGAETLTPRELEIVQMIAAGCTIKEVSQRLHLSPRTVQKHEENIRTKLGLVNRASVAAWAVRQGLAGV